MVVKNIFVESYRPNMDIRQYKSTDLEQIARLFYEELISACGKIRSYHIICKYNTICLLYDVLMRCILFREILFPDAVIYM